ncbi:MAG: DNA repair protein RecO [Elusimicrobia bacterium]|nr:DNA repair protein RecO [Candidatus Liberimonas magnetica]
MYQNSFGLILKASVLNEADKLLTIYTRQWGKIFAVAPGAKKIKAKYIGATEPIIETDFMFYFTSSTSRPKVTGAKILNSFPCLTKNWRRHFIAQYCAEICDKLTPLQSQNLSKYDLLHRSWKLLETADNPWRIYIAYALRFLKLSGYDFSEYIKKEDSYMTKDETEVIRHLSIFSGDDIDKNLSIEQEMEETLMKKIDNFIAYYLHHNLSTKKQWQKLIYA